MKLERTHIVTDTEDIIWILRELEGTIEDLKEENESLQTQNDELYGEVADSQSYSDSIEETMLELRDKLKEKESLIQELQARLRGLEK